MEEYEKGEFYLKDTTFAFGLLGSSPDFMLAASKFEEAANKFRMLKDFKNAGKSYWKCAECFVKLDSLFLAAQNFEKAGMMLESDQKREALRLAVQYYTAGMAPENAYKVLDKMATDNPLDAPSLYLKAAKIMEDSDQLRMGTDILQKALKFCIGDIPLAIQFSEYLESAYTGELQSRQVVITGLLHLSARDYQKAEQKFIDTNDSRLQLLLCEYLKGPAEFAAAVSTLQLQPVFMELASNIVVCPVKENDNIEDEIEENGYL